MTLVLVKRIPNGGLLNVTQHDANLTNIENEVNGKAENDDPRFIDARTPTAHNQAMSTITGLVDALADKATIGALADLATVVSGKVSDDDGRLIDARYPKVADYGGWTMLSGNTAVLDVDSVRNALLGMTPVSWASGDAIAVMRSGGTVGMLLSQGLLADIMTDVANGQVIFKKADGSGIGGYDFSTDLPSSADTIYNDPTDPNETVTASTYNEVIAPYDANARISGGILTVNLAAYPHMNWLVTGITSALDIQIDNFPAGTAEGMPITITIQMGDTSQPVITFSDMSGGCLAVIGEEVPPWQALAVNNSTLKLTFFPRGTSIAVLEGVCTANVT